MKVLNFSRHALSSDQQALLREMGVEFEATPKSPFFNSSDDVVRAVGETGAAALVAPFNLILKAVKSGLKGRVYSWVADEAARSKGKFALAGVEVFTFDGEGNFTVESREWTPGVLVDFRTGEESPYEV